MKDAKTTSPFRTFCRRSSSFRSQFLLIFGSRQQNHCWLLGGRTEFNSYFTTTTPRSPTLLATRCEVACSLTQSDYEGVRTQVSTLRGMRDLLLLQRLTLIQTHIWNPNTDCNIYFAVYPIYVLCMLLNNYPINIARLLNHLDTSHFNHTIIGSINRYCELMISTLKQSYKHIIHKHTDLRGSLPLGSYIHKNCSSSIIRLVNSYTIPSYTHNF